MHLLKYFDKLSLRPENAKELKGLILDLAIRGRLTEEWRKENPEVEPATDLVEKIKATETQLIKKKKVRKGKPLAPITPAEYLFNIPTSWAFERLGNVGDWGAGATPKRSNPELYGGDINWFKSGELNNGIINFESKEKITELALKKSSLRLNIPGDILIAMYGATIGKTARLEVKGTTNQAVCGCTCYKGFNNLFLHILLTALKSIFINQGEGGAQPNISRVKIRNQVFPLPPLAEQKAIVKVVNQLMDEVDQLESQTKTRVDLRHDFIHSSLRQLTSSDSQKTWKKLQPHFTSFFDTVESIDKLKEAILQLAVQGKLTKQWRKDNPDVESAAVLLEKIKAEKAKLIEEKKIRKKRSTDSIIKGHCDWAKPDSWSEVELQDLFKFIDYRGKNPQKASSGKRLITAKNIRMGYIKEDPIEFVSDAVYKTWMTRGFPQSGDLLFITEGHTMGFVTKIDLDYDFALAQRTICFQPFIKLDSTFFLYLIMTNQFKSILIDNQTGSAAGGVKASKLKRINIPLPSLLEQKAIIEISNQLISLCDQMKLEIEHRNDLSKDFLRSSIREVMEETQALVQVYTIKRH